MQIKYQSDSGQWLCFKHAIKRALLDQNIESVTDEDDFCSDYDMRDTSCSDCGKGDTP